MADACPVCHEPRPHGRDMSWPEIAGMFFGFWRGWIWTGAGFRSPELSRRHGLPAVGL